MNAVWAWLVANTAGNLAASAIWGPVAFAIGLGVGKVRERRAEARHQELMEAHRAVHRHLGIDS